MAKLEAELISAEELIKAEDEEIVGLAAAVEKKTGLKKNAQKDKRNDMNKKFTYESDANNTEANIVFEKDTWLADSGASFHMSYDKSIFVNLTGSEHKSVVFGDNQNLEVIGEGEVHIKVLQDNEWKPWRLTKVLCVSKLRNNLFSYSACTKYGYKILSDYDNIKIMKDNKIMASGGRFKHLYRMLFKTCNIIQANVAENSETPGLQKLRLWHERLSHASYVAENDTEQFFDWTSINRSTELHL